MIIENSLFLYNSSNTTGGAVYLNVYDYAATGQARIINSSFVGNWAYSIYDHYNNSGCAIFNSESDIELHNTLFARNVAGINLIPNDYQGKSVIAGSANNLISDAATSGNLQDGVNGNIIGVNGSGTCQASTVLNIMTGKLIEVSLAIEAGDASLALDRRSIPLLSDVDGNVRIQGFDVDIGASEGFVFLNTSLAGFVNGSWWVSSPDANGDYSTSRWAQWPVESLRTVVRGDFNGDGQADIVARRDDNGEWRGLTSIGTAFTTRVLTTWSSTADWQHVHVGHFANPTSPAMQDLIGIFPQAVSSMAEDASQAEVAAAPNPGRWTLQSESLENSLNSHEVPRQQPSVVVRSSDEEAEHYEEYGDADLLDLLYSV